MSPTSRTTAATDTSSRRPRPHPSTTVLLVRHGQTATTGKVLPGRAKGLHLADTGRGQAERVAERIGELTVPPCTHRRWNAPARRRRRSPRPPGPRCGSTRACIECDFGEWTGRAAGRPDEAPGVAHRAAGAVDVPLSRAARASPRCSTASSSALDRLRREHAGATIVCVSHADPIKAAIAQALGTHLDLFQRIVISTCSVSALTWLGGGRRSCSRSTPPAAR